MGIAFVLLFWLIFGLCIALLVGVVMALFGRNPLKRQTFGDRIERFRFPFATLAWIGFIFVLQAIGNYAIFKQDPGIGDGWECRLPAGFSLLMIDTVDYGWIKSPRGELKNKLGDIVLLQAAANSFWIASVMPDFDRDWSKQLHSTHFFRLNSSTDKMDRFETESAMRIQAETEGIRLDLKPIHEVYQQYRNHTIDLLAIAAAIGGPIYWWRKRQPA